MKLLVFIFSFFATLSLKSEAFIIKDYAINIKVNEKGYLDIEEIIKVNFTESRRGIIRSIPYVFRIAPNDENNPRAQGFENVGSNMRTLISNIEVDNWKYSVSKSGAILQIRIGSPQIYLTGDQEYRIKYRVHDAINFFKDHSELYFNIIGTEWDTEIENAHFEISLPKTLIDRSNYFVSTGVYGSKENQTVSSWVDDKTFKGSITQKLNPHEGVTIGIKFPVDFVEKENYKTKGFYWLFLIPIAVSTWFYSLWKKYGKDEGFSIQTEFKAPAEISPAVAGYLMNDKHKKRDLTSLIPYWGEKGYLKIKEHETGSFLGFGKTKELEFIKVSDLKPEAPSHEKTMFNGIFSLGSPIMLSDLKDNIYQKMQYSSIELENYINAKKYYTESGNLWRDLMLFLSIVLLIGGLIGTFFTFSSGNFFLMYMCIGAMISSIAGFIIFSHMPKKTRIGTDLYKKLCGFKEFIKTVEKDKLELFLKEDPGYFDKVLPFAIVFNVAQEWKKRFEGLEIPPPSWYVGSSPNFNYYYFMNSIDHSLDEVSENIYSVPSNSGSAGSGGSFGGSGGGFSGGGFGGGGGSSW